MFDISWQDPTAETVAQRKSRIAQQPPPRPNSALSSASSETSTRRHRPSVLNLFHRSRRDLAEPEPRSSRSTLRGRPSVEPVGPVAFRDVSELASPDRLSRRQLDAKTPTATFYLDDLPTGAVELPSGSVRGSVRGSYTTLDEQNFTRWATQSVISDSSWGSTTDLARRSQLVQPLSPTSFHSCLTQGTEVTTASPTDHKDHSKSSPTSRDSPRSEEKAQHTKRSPSASSFDMPLQDFSAPAESKTLMQNDPVTKPIVAVMMVGGQESLRAVSTLDVPSDETAVPSLPPKNPARDRPKTEGSHEGTVKLDLSYFQKSVRRMEAASVRIVLERLTEEWTEIPDAALYVELDLEKKLWMRTALHTNCQEKSFRSVVSPQFSHHEPAGSEATKLLSLYEDHASTTFLSALNQTAEIHHLSPYPLLTDASTNLRPLFVPGLTSTLPYDSAFFNSIHASLSLTSLLPAASIPQLLSECARTLAPDRTLNLVLMDPSPIPSTAGPFLRSWLDIHLIIPLERAAHCTNPSTMFPRWLADAGLNGDGSRMSSRRFAAAAETALIVSYNQGEGVKGGLQEETRQELKRMVGMMLWEEIWGDFIKGPRRWWNDREVMAECVRLGTTWEYLVVEAVKEEMEDVDDELGGGEENMDPSDTVV